MADNQTLKKRLIISGITPAITGDALSQRLASFGTVESIDGVGSLDSNGQPRKFAHLTLVTTRPKLSRCITALSGSTWKGAKLRVGEARPDWTQRIASEKDIVPGKRGLEDHDLSSDPVAKRPKKALISEKKIKKRTRRSSGEAPDMSLVTLENIKQKKGWNVTSDNHLIRPIRMRPSHPLPPALPATGVFAPSASQDSGHASKATKSNTKSVKIDPKVQRKKTPMTKKTTLADGPAKKSRNKLTRARRTIIDPTRYGAVHRKLSSSDVHDSRHDGQWTYDAEAQKWVRLADDGAIVDVESVRLAHSVSKPLAELVETDSAVETSLSLPSTSAAWNPSTLPALVANQPDFPSPSSSTPPAPVLSQSIMNAQPTMSAIKSGLDDDEIANQLRDEKAKGLAIMRSLLEKGWEVGSDDGVAGGEKVIRMASASVGSESGTDDGNNEETDQTMEAEEIAEVSAIGPQIHEDSDSENDSTDGPPAIPAQPQSTSQPKSLKDMFAPREEDAGFSLFGNLAASGVDIDLELDEDEASYPIAATTVNQTSAAAAITAPAPIFRDDAVSFDPLTPMFFPIAPSQRDELPGKKSIRPKDLFDISLDRGWAAKAGGGFWRTSSEEEIRKRWDTVKGDLTREYKKRHREALKKRKRGHGISIADRDAN